MKINKNKIKAQRDVIEKKLKGWRSIRSDKTPPSGWIKAIRGALGMSTYQLAKLMGINQATALRIEKREAEGKVTLDILKKAADAMDCKLVYAIVPKEQYSSLDDIINEHAEGFARNIIKRTEHTMQLEKQGSGSSKSELKKMVKELKDDVDSRIWEKGTKRK
jgi:predicted DNA-binding mobile mystery protein A